MSMDSHTYVGYYIKAKLKPDVSGWEVFEDESWVNVYDEGGNKELTSKTDVVFIYNRDSEESQYLNDMATGVFDLPQEPTDGLPDFVKDGYQTIIGFSDSASIHYGIIRWFS